MFLSTPFHPQISSFRTFVIIWGQARVMRGGWKCMEAARQNHGCHMSGLTVLTDCIMMACRWIVVGSQNWKTSLSCCWRSMRTASRCSGSREWEHLTVGWSITTIWMSAPSWKHKKKGEDFTQGFVSTFSKTLCHSWVCPCNIFFEGCFKVGTCQSCMPPKKRRMKCKKGLWWEVQVWFLPESTRWGKQPPPLLTKVGQHVSVSKDCSSWR